MDESEARKAQAEDRHEGHLIAQIAMIGGLAFALEELYSLRNQPTPELTADQSEQRKMLIGMVIKMVRNKMRRLASERFAPTLKELEMLDG